MKIGLFAVKTTFVDGEKGDDDEDNDDVNSEGNPDDLDSDDE